MQFVQNTDPNSIILYNGHYVNIHVPRCQFRKTPGDFRLVFPLNSEAMTLMQQWINEFQNAIPNAQFYWMNCVRDCVEMICLTLDPEDVCIYRDTTDDLMIEDLEDETQTVETLIWIKNVTLLDTATNLYKLNVHVKQIMIITVMRRRFSLDLPQEQQQQQQQPQPHQLMEKEQEEDEVVTLQQINLSLLDGSSNSGASSPILLQTPRTILRAKHDRALQRFNKAIHLYYLALHELNQIKKLVETAEEGEEEL